MSESEFSVSRRKLNTFVIKGGSRLALDVTMNPKLEHGGVLTVWHAILSPDEVVAITNVIESHGCNVRVHLVTMNQEQRELKKIWLGKLKIIGTPSASEVSIVTTSPAKDPTG